MTQQATPDSSLQRAFRLGRAGLVIGLTGLLVTGCSGMMPRNSTKSLTPVDTQTLPDAADSVAKESAMLQATQDKLQQQIEKAPSAQPLPPVQPVYDPLEDKVVTIRMYDASVSTLLWAMSDQLGMNLILDPSVQSIKRHATLNLTNVTAREVFNHILDAFDLHGEVRGNTLYVDLMNEKIYNLDFLGTRMNVDISDGGNVFGGNSGGSGSGAGGGQGGGGSGSGSSSNSLRSDFTLSGGLTNQNGIYKQIDDGLKMVLGDAAQTRNRLQQGSDQQTDNTPIYSLNPLTGTLFVRARPSQIRSVDKMVNQYKRVMGRQVQIDAQLVDVQLNDGYQFGVDWNLMRKYVSGIVGDAPLSLAQAVRDFPATDETRLPPRTMTIPDQLIGNTPGRSIGLGYANDKFSVALNMLRTFGNVQILSNPTIRTRNGSPAMLSVGTNIRFLSSSASTISNTGGGASTVQTNAQTDSLFSGLMVGIVPFIHEDGTVELLVHPVQSDVDPSSLKLIDAGGGSRISLPVTSFKGMTTTLNIQDGATVMIGGLIDQQLGDDHSGVPGIADIPGVGKLFDQTKKSHRSRELVIVLRARVL